MQETNKELVMDIKVGQIWNGKTDGEEVEVLDYIERNNAVRYKYLLVS